VPSRRSRQKQWLAVLALVFVAAFFVDVFIIPHPRIMFSAGKTYSLSVESFMESSIASSSPTTISGAYTASAPVEFFVMTDSQHSSYQATGFGAEILALDYSVTIPAGHYFYQTVTVARPGVLAGSFNASSTVTFYLLTRAQYALYTESRTIPSWTLSMGPSKNMTLSGNIGAIGSYYTVIIPVTSINTTISVGHTWEVTYPVQSSEYVYSSLGRSANFSLSLDPGTYYVVWVDVGESGEQVTMTQDVKAS
jgi:hypothetical protein